MPKPSRTNPVRGPAPSRRGRVGGRVAAAVALLMLATAPAWGREANSDDVFAVSVDTQLIQLVAATEHDRLYPVEVNGYWGHMNRLGALVVFPRYDWTDYSHAGLARAVLDEKVGYIGHAGRWVIEPQFDDAQPFTEGLAAVGRADRFGLIDRRGRAVLALEYQGVLSPAEGLAAVQRGDRVGYVEATGTWVIEPSFAMGRSFSEGRAAVGIAQRGRSETILAYIDPTGTRLMVDEAGRFTALGDYRQGLARARSADSGLWGYLDRDFEWAIPPRFTDCRDFVGRLAAVKVEDRWGYVNAGGDEVVSPRFHEAGDFSDVLALVHDGEGFGYADRRGRMRIAGQFERARPFYHGYARVGHEAGWAYIDARGALAWDPRRARLGFLHARSGATPARSAGLPADAAPGSVIAPPSPRQKRSLIVDRLIHSPRELPRP